MCKLLGLMTLCLMAMVALISTHLIAMPPGNAYLPPLPLPPSLEPIPRAIDNKELERYAPGYATDYDYRRPVQPQLGHPLGQQHEYELDLPQVEGGRHLKLQLVPLEGKFEAHAYDNERVNAGPAGGAAEAEIPGYHY